METGSWDWLLWWEVCENGFLWVRLGVDVVGALTGRRHRGLERGNGDVLERIGSEANVDGLNSFIV